MAIKILSHNVYWFQGHPFSGSCPQSPNRDILRRLCTLYREAGASVLCLQEVQSADVAGNVAAEMNMKSIHAPGVVYPQYGSLIATSCDAPQRLADPSSSVLERSLVAAKISLPSAETLGVACIHLTSGRQTSASEAAAARVAEISEFLTAHGAETDVLAGDFNEDPDGAVANLLSANGFLDAALLFKKESISSLIKGTKRRDLIWIKAKWRDRIIDYGVIQELDVTDLEGKTFLSDHRPLWITLDA